MRWVLGLLCSLILISCAGDEFTADCGTWGEFSQCRELNDVELEIYNDVASCMGILDQLPSPTVVIVKGLSIECGDVRSAGCQTGGFVGFPEQESDALESEFIWRHEFTHEILELTTGGADRNHHSEWFTSNTCIK